MNPDPGSEGGLSYEAEFKRGLIQLEPSGKTADSPFLGAEQIISARKQPRQKIVPR
jgi:hypothetical protein